MISNIIKAKDILAEQGASGLETAMNADNIFTLDFDGVENISFASLRTLLNCYRKGFRFSVINASADVVERFVDSGVSSYIDITRKPKPVDLEKYSIFGEGYLSKAFNSQDGDSMLKMYGNNMPEEVVIREKNVARAVLLFGLNTPMVGTVYDYQGNKCLDFERIEGKRSFSRIISEEPDRIEELSLRFAKMCKQLHSTPCDTHTFTDRTIIYRNVIASSQAINEEQKAKVLAFIDSIPKATTCLHGDLQPSNVITNGKEDFWIDLSDFGYGYPLLDLGMWYFLSCLNPEELTQHIFHLSQDVMRNVWKIFATEYFGADTPQKQEKARQEVEPFAALHMLYLGSLYGFRPGMMEFIEKTLL